MRFKDAYKLTFGQPKPNNKNETISKKAEHEKLKSSIITIRESIEAINDESINVSF